MQAVYYELTYIHLNLSPTKPHKAMGPIQWLSQFLSTHWIDCTVDGVYFHAFILSMYVQYPPTIWVVDTEHWQNNGIYVQEVHDTCLYYLCEGDGSSFNFIDLKRMITGLPEHGKLVGCQPRPTCIFIFID